MKSRLLPLLFAACTIPPSLGEPYWIAYEGDVFPENCGWHRRTMGGGAERYIEDGVFVLDSRPSTPSIDYYKIEFNGALDPGEGEWFHACWRLRVDDLIGPADPTLSVYSDDGAAVAFSFTETGVRNIYDYETVAPFMPGVYHAFEFTSPDMVTYELRIDDELALAGDFYQSFDGSWFGWGDEVQAAASLTHWDYVRFGVIPEPAGGILFVFAIVLSISARVRSRAGLE